MQALSTPSRKARLEKQPTPQHGSHKKQTPIKHYNQHQIAFAQGTHTYSASKQLPVKHSKQVLYEDRSRSTHLNHSISDS